MCTLAALGFFGLFIPPQTCWELSACFGLQPRNNSIPIVQSPITSSNQCNL